MTFVSELSTEKQLKKAWGEECTVELFSLVKEAKPRKIIYKNMQRNTRHFGSPEC